MEENVFQIGLFVIISIFVLSIVFIISTYIIEGNIYPMLKGLEPSVNESKGISQEQYRGTLEFLKNGKNWIFYIILAIPFLYIVIKLWYEREETSVYGGYP